MSNPSEVQSQTSGTAVGGVRTADSPEEAKRLQARSDSYPIFTTAYALDRRSISTYAVVKIGYESLRA